MILLKKKIIFVLNVFLLFGIFTTEETMLSIIKIRNYGRNKEKKQQRCD